MPSPSAGPDVWTHAEGIDDVWTHAEGIDAVWTHAEGIDDVWTHAEGIDAEDVSALRCGLPPR